MKRNHLSKRQTERNEIALRQMLSVIVLKHHHGYMVIDAKEMSDVLSRVSEISISVDRSIMKIIVKTKEE